MNSHKKAQETQKISARFQKIIIFFEIALQFALGKGVLCFLCLFVAIATIGNVFAGELESGFVNPPDSAKPHVYWYWAGVSMTKEGLTADLEAMERVGIGGAILMNIAGGITTNGVVCLSDEWFDLVTYSIKEADRLGLKINLFTCAGWSASGGPWIDPEHNMQTVVWSETDVKGPGKVEIQLPKPETKLDFYRDIGVLAVKKRVGYEGKTSKSADVFSSAFKKVAPEGAVAPELVIPVGEVLNLTGKMDKDGMLNWSAPASEWTVMRFGHTASGQQNSCPAPGGVGLECDKMSREAVKMNFEGLVGRVSKEVGPLTGKTLNSVHYDSYEAHYLYWTEGFRKEFKRLRGYDPVQYLPVLTGRVLGSMEVSERFQWDMRYVVSRLMLDNYFEYTADMCHEKGMVLTMENYGWPSSITPFDGMGAAGRVDIPMGEFWMGRPVAGDRRDGRCINAISGAHLHGKKVVAAESFTCRSKAGNYSNHPFKLKPKGDYAYCMGINKFVFHVYGQQPWPNAKPGLGGLGIHFQRNATWWEQGAAWLKYIQRCQYLLQQGLSVVDICYYWGNNVPNAAPVKHPVREQFSPVPPEGFKYDICSRDSFLERMSVKNGRIVLPDGMTYSVLVMPKDRKMTPEILRKVKDMVQAGMTIVGPSPLTSPSLVDYPDCDKEIAKLASEIWGKCDGDKVTMNSCGKGKVFWGKELKEVLAAIDVEPDFDYDRVHPDLRYHHKQIGDSSSAQGYGEQVIDMYFVANGSYEPREAMCSFRVAGKKPELWHPETGEVRDLADWEIKDGRTYIPLKFDESESYFVVFRRQLAVGSWQQPRSGGVSASLRGKNFAEYKEVQKIEGPWEVEFPEGWGAPPSIKLDKLISWTDHSDNGVKYFSGTAVYRKVFDLSKSQISNLKSQIHLQLGEVKVIAEVRLNGKDLGVLWKPPFRVDVTDVLKEGSNELEIRLTNLWPNRMIGDEREFPGDWNPKNSTELPEWLKKGEKNPSGRYTFVYPKIYKDKDKLLESGLLGPVRILKEK